MNTIINKFKEFKRDFLIILAIETTIIASSTILIAG